MRTVRSDVRVERRSELLEFSLCGRPVRKVQLLGTLVDVRLKTTATRDATKGEHGRCVCECV